MRELGTSKAARQHPVPCEHHRAHNTRRSVPDGPRDSDAEPQDPNSRQLEFVRPTPDGRGCRNAAKSPVVSDETRRRCRNYLINKGLRPVGGGGEDYYRRPGHAIFRGFPGHVMMVDALMRICQAPTEDFFHDLDSPDALREPRRGWMRVGRQMECCGNAANAGSRRRLGLASGKQHDRPLLECVEALASLLPDCRQPTAHRGESSTIRSDWNPPASFVPSLVVFRFRSDVLFRERAVRIGGQTYSTASLRSLGRTA